MDLKCFVYPGWKPRIRPASSRREWMDSAADSFPYRCLPLTMANTTGWELLCPVGFTAEWSGSPQNEAITLRPDRPHPDFHDLCKAHFGGGILTFHPGYLFRTPPGWDLIAAGPPNLPKDGIQPLSGLVETDWLPFPFTMNWIFTRPGRVRFEKGEPFCFISLTPHRVMDQVQPVQRSMASDDALRNQYEAWIREREAFNKKLGQRDPEAVRDAWQRYYFKGEIPDDMGPAPTDHVNKRRLKSLKIGR